MKKSTFFILLSFVSMSFAQQKNTIGINLIANHSWSTEIAFTDVMKQGGEWITSDADRGNWDSKLTVPLLANGYPEKIPYSDGTHKPQIVKTLLFEGFEDRIPSGEYRLIVQGSGKVRLTSGASGNFDTPVDTLVSVSNRVILHIDESKVTDPITDIKFIRPEYVDTYKENIFTDELKDFLKDFTCIRFMDWTRTNNSKVSKWSDRAKHDYYTQTTAKGVSWENVIALSNELNTDLWVNIPHLADDDYVRQLALFFKGELKPSLKIHVEYGNEVWNSGFGHHKEIADLASEEGYEGNSYGLAAQYNAKRSADIFTIFEDVFNADDRIVKVLPTQATVPWLSEQIIGFFNSPKYNPSGIEADALAIAPYFKGGANKIVEEGLLESITPRQIVNRMKDGLDEAFNNMKNQDLIAKENDLELIAYEGGQHLVAVGPLKNNVLLTEKLTAANRHRNLQQVYCEYFSHWFNNYGGLFMHFSSHGDYDKSGSWGVKEYMEDFNNPKYLALKNCVFPVGSDTITEGLQPFPKTMGVFPNPSWHHFTTTSIEPITTIAVYDIQGQKLDIDFERVNDDWKFNIDMPGIYIVIFNNTYTGKIIKN